MKGLEVRDLKDIQKYLEKNLHEDAFHYNEFRQMRKLLVKLINIIDFRKKKKYSEQSGDSTKNDRICYTVKNLHSRFEMVQNKAKIWFQHQKLEVEEPPGHV